ncbi:M4 family metallopeptidase [Massilia niabensis]|uniref:Neutral metalloproteinase n=1 Tax=Massilia niabensis TaxID=544910 RepID=A0ABW0LBU0_9BURK
MPPYILKNLLDKGSPDQRDMALKALLSATALRADRRFVARLGFIAPVSGAGKQRMIFDCRNKPTTRNAVLVRRESDRSNGDIAAIEAFDGVGTTYDFYSQIFHRNSIDNAGMRLDSYVHYGEKYPNAMWDGRRMIFGDGDGVLFSRLTQSLDVIGHELTHGVTQYTANLEYRGQSGALNESVSDVFGSLVKQWSLSQTAAQADWLVGTECWTPDIHGDALRSMKNPGSAYNDPLIGKDPQPGHMRDYKLLPETPEGDMGGVHINSGIPNHAFYLFASSIGGVAWETAGQVWYEALQRSKKDTNFDLFANTTYAIAGENFDTSTQQALQAAWDEVGIRVGKKEKILTGRTAAARERSNEDLATSIERLTRQIGSLRDDIEALKQSSGHVH